MKVSIVVPTYNQGCYIRDCLIAIQEQTYSDFEVIIQDSVSKDETQEICEHFAKTDPRFRYYREKDTGQSDAINRGLARSSGDLWTWICSDDYFAHHRVFEFLVERFIQEKEKNKAAVGVFGDAQYVTHQNAIVGPYMNHEFNIIRSDFKYTWPLAQPSSLLLREAVVQAGGVDASLYLGMDLDLFIKVLKGGKYFLYVPVLTVNIRLQPDSKSVKFRRKTAENALMILKGHFGNIGSKEHSMFVREYAMARRIEIIERVKDILWMCVPFNRILRKWVHSLQSQAHLYMDPKYKRRNLGIYLFRLVWGTYRLLKRYVINPIRSHYIYPLKKRIARSMEQHFRSSGFTLP